MNDHVFVDLDNTLIAAEYNTFSKFSKPRTRVYGVILREGSDKFLKALREKYKHVYMLTAATQDYAEAMNNAFSFGFVKKEIISRDRYYDLYNFTEGRLRSVLVDDLRASEPNTQRKINYLKMFGVCGFVQIKPFHGHKNGGLTDEYIKDIINSIDAQFKAL